MNFDATVRLGDLLALGTAMLGLLGLLIWFFGQKYFPSKSEMADLRAHVDKQIADARQDMQNSVNRIEIRSHERHEELRRDFERVESAITAMLSDVRDARDMSMAATASAREANIAVASHGEGIARMERMVEALLNRPRNPNNRES